MSDDVMPASAGKGAVARGVTIGRDRWFFGAMGVVMALTVFAGFAPTYFLRAMSDRPALAPLLQWHGAVFTGWIALFIVQTALIASKRIALHRRLGWAGAALAAAMLVVGYAAAVDSAARGFTPPGGPPPLVFFAIPVGDLLTFAALLIAGLALRRRAAAHKRLMLLATIALMPPAIARLPHVVSFGPLAFFILTDLFVVALLVYDRAARGRIHPASLWGGLVVILSQPLRLLVAGTALWMSFATWATA